MNDLDSVYICRLFTASLSDFNAHSELLFIVSIWCWPMLIQIEWIVFRVVAVICWIFRIGVLKIVLVCHMAALEWAVSVVLAFAFVLEYNGIRSPAVRMVACFLVFDMTAQKTVVSGASQSLMLVVVITAFTMILSFSNIDLCIELTMACAVAIVAIIAVIRWFMIVLLFQSFVAVSLRNVVTSMQFLQFRQQMSRRHRKGCNDALIEKNKIW